MDCNTCLILLSIIIGIITLIIIISINSPNCNKCTDSFRNKDSRHKPLERLAIDNNIQYILDKKLCDFWINTSHNSFLEGWQVGGESRVSNVKGALDSGARCIELDLHKATGSVGGIWVQHTGSAPGYFEDYLSIIKDNAFKNTNDPLIIYLEIADSNNEYYMAEIGNLINKYLGNRLYEGRMDNLNPSNYCMNVPIRQLLGKVIIVINYFNMNVGRGLEYRNKYLFPVCHATTDEPDGGWFKQYGQLIRGKNEKDKLEYKPQNQLMRVYPNNIVKSGNYDPNAYWSSNYNLVALNFGNEDDYLQMNHNKFKYCSILPFDIIISKDGEVKTPIKEININGTSGLLYSNVNIESNMILPNKAYTNECRWWSNNYEYYLQIHNDGNLVLYNKKNKSLWSSKTSGNPNAILFMQPDGNLVIYDSSLSRALWSSQTFNNPGAYAVITNGNVFANSDFLINNKQGGKIKKIY